MGEGDGEGGREGGGRGWDSLLLKNKHPQPTNYHLSFSETNHDHFHDTVVVRKDGAWVGIKMIRNDVD